MDQSLVQQARSCFEYAACKEQMGNAFSAIQLSPLVLYQGPKTNHACTSDILTLLRAVRDSNCPNYMGIRIPVASKSKIKNWKYYLADYWDKHLLDLLFSHSISTGISNCSLLKKHHASGRDHVHDTEYYIQEELKHGAMLGGQTYYCRFELA